MLGNLFGISRKTGYKIYERYKDAGLRGLSDRTRRRWPEVACPAISTVRAVLDRHGLVRYRRRRRRPRLTRHDFLRPETVAHVSGIICLPMSPEWTLDKVAPRAGLEPATLRLTD